MHSLHRSQRSISSPTQTITKFSKHQKVDIFIRYFQQRIRKEISFFRKTYMTLALTSAIKVERTLCVRQSWRSIIPIIPMQDWGVVVTNKGWFFLHPLRIKPSVLSLGNVLDSTIKARARNVIAHMNVDSFIAITCTQLTTAM